MFSSKKSKDLQIYLRETTGPLKRYEVISSFCSLVSSAYWHPPDSALGLQSEQFVSWIKFQHHEHRIHIFFIEMTLDCHQEYSCKSWSYTFCIITVLLVEQTQQQVQQQVNVKTVSPPNYAKAQRRLSSLQLPSHHKIIKEPLSFLGHLRVSNCDWTVQIFNFGRRRSACTQSVYEISAFLVFGNVRIVAICNKYLIIIIYNEKMRNYAIFYRTYETPKSYWKSHNRVILQALSLTYLSPLYTRRVDRRQRLSKVKYVWLVQRYVPRCLHLTGDLQNLDGRLITNAEQCLTRFCV